MQRTAILTAVLVLAWAVCLLAGGGRARAGETRGGSPCTTRVRSWASGGSGATSNREAAVPTHP